MIKKLLIFLTSIPFLLGATWYVDCACPNNGNGQAKNCAGSPGGAGPWNNPASISGPSALDEVWLSGGSTTQTCVMAASWSPPDGTDASNRITYKIWPESGKNGTIVFDGTAASVSAWVDGLNHAIISGDAGDGNRHIKIVGYTTAISVSVANLKVEYVDASEDGALASFVYNGGYNYTGFWMRYNKVKIDSMTADAAVNFGVTCTGECWNTNIVEYNEFELPQKIGTGGPDCFVGGTGMTVRGNTVKYVENASFSGGQHPDGVQFLGVQYFIVDGNYFENVSNYCLFFENINGFSHGRVINNICALTSQSLSELSTVGGIITGLNADCDPCTWDDVLIANNVVVDYAASAQSYAWNNPGANTPGCTDCYFYNNVRVNSAGDLVGSGTGMSGLITRGGDAAITAANAPNTFTSYTALGGLSNDLRLKVTDTVLKDQGTAISSGLWSSPIDKNGVSRPQGAAWDIGAYEYITAPIVGVTAVGVVIK